MPYSVVEKKLRSIPESYMSEIMEYLSLIEYKVRYESERESSKLLPKKKGFGCLKDPDFWMADDFDEPLEDFAEYM